VPNSISDDTVKDTVDEVLQKLEDELIHEDKDYKLTVRQKEH
jgi:ABC-type transporter MlaC component